jgi:hypothetical protein
MRMETSGRSYPSQGNLSNGWAFVAARSHVAEKMNHEPNIDGPYGDTRKGAAEIQVWIESGRLPSCASHPGHAPRTGMSPRHVQRSGSDESIIRNRRDINPN